jgi:hypothetical protein
MAFSKYSRLATKKKMVRGNEGCLERYELLSITGVLIPCLEGRCYFSTGIIGIVVLFAVEFKKLSF